MLGTNVCGLPLANLSLHAGFPVCIFVGPCRRHWFTQEHNYDDHGSLSGGCWWIIILCRGCLIHSPGCYSATGVWVYFHRTAALWGNAKLKYIAHRQYISITNWKLLLPVFGNIKYRANSTDISHLSVLQSGRQNTSTFGHTTCNRVPDSLINTHKPWTGSERVGQAELQSSRTHSVIDLRNNTGFERVGDLYRQLAMWQPRESKRARFSIRGDKTLGHRGRRGDEEGNDPGEPANIEQIPRRGGR